MKSCVYYKIPYKSNLLKIKESIYRIYKMHYIPKQTAINNENENENKSNNETMQFLEKIFEAPMMLSYPLIKYKII